MLSNVASDLLTGNHLLGRPRTLEYKCLLSEFTTAAEKANEGKRLTRRQAALLKEMETMFHDGREDMAEQLGIKKETFIKYINCKSKLPNKHRQKLMNIFKDVMMQHGWTEDIFFHYNKEITK